jgi:hypothetical protein
MGFAPMRQIEHAGRANQIEGDLMYEQRVSAILFAATTLGGRKQLEMGPARLVLTFPGARPAS